MISEYDTDNQTYLSQFHSYILGKENINLCWRYTGTLDNDNGAIV